MAGDLICPNVQSKKYPVHGSWIKFKDKFPDSDWSKAVEYSDEGKGKGSGKGKKGKGIGKGKSSKGNISRNPNNGRFQTNTVQVQDGQVEPGFEFAEREELSGNQPHRVLAVAQTSETAQSMSFEEVSVAEEDVTPPGTSKEWINIPGSGSHHIYAWPLHIGSADVEDVFQQQLESDNTIPFKIEARCVECNETCAPVRLSMTLKSSKWAGPKPGYKSVCFCGTIDLLSRQKVEQLTLSGVSFGRKEVTPTNLVCEYCQIGGFGPSTISFSLCRYCGASPSYHHGRCCMNKTVGRPHSMKSELGSVQSGKSLPEVSEERFGEFVIDSNHSEDYIFKLTYGYINQSTVNSEEATIVKPYL
jgi:hypothetical protein